MKDSLHYDGIQALRGLAALAVLLHHFSVMVSKEKYYGAVLLQDIFMNGYRGVDLFFVISGFIMMSIIYEKKSNSEFINFLAARIIRIYIPYWIVFCTMTISYFIFPMVVQGGYSFDFNIFIKNILLLPRADITSYVPVVAWTLSFEMFFYFLISLIFLVNTKWFWGIFVIWQSACLVSLFSMIEFDTGAGIVTNYLNIAFGVGIVSFLLQKKYQNKIQKIPFLPAIFLISLIIMAADSRLKSVFSELILLVTMGLIVTVFAQSKQRTLEWVGKVSYSLYLVHYPIIAVSFIIIFKLDLQNYVPPELLLVATLVMSLAVAYISWWIVEFSACGRLRSFINRVS